ncbi:hypothetical protein Nepgr_032929 [Nepenthes gracilis]|uniref:Pentatricopeptide repeat-containing protein n=1 Tax=Nepenthes gracilis TaxID=150966 RepID=A0AAD3TL52_NEPGR|nr:hypothetical protein Nepgr_032929 [Nepenthes gracilis]
MSTNVMLYWGTQEFVSISFFPVMWHPFFITRVKNSLKDHILKKCVRSMDLDELNGVSRKCCRSMSMSSFPCPLETQQFKGTRIISKDQFSDSTGPSDLNVVIAKVQDGSDVNKILGSLMHDESCSAICINHSLVDQLLHCFKDDWNSALGVFRWAETRPCFEHAPEAYDLMVDILGKMRRFDEMEKLVDEMRQRKLVTLKTVAKIMRRFAGADQWEHAARIFDELETFGLMKNTESVNLLLDTLCKEKQVEWAREIFLQLKSHIPPTAHTFNIFIHGWCKVNRVDEAHWTIQEMKGHGFHPCVISYSTIIQSYCQQSNYSKVYELLDEMAVAGCPPNVVTYTTIMCWLTKSENFDGALQIAKRLKSIGCKPDTLFYNAFIHALGRAGRVREAVDVFKVEMPKNSVTPNTSTYNTMIAMLCHHGRPQDALDFLKDMEKSQFCKPDVQTFYPLLKHCFKSANANNCLKELLDKMANRHHLSIDMSTFTLLIHGLCRADKCRWAYLFFEEMIGRGMAPSYRTCRFILHEFKQKNMQDAAERIEVYMKQTKASL